MEFDFLSVSFAFSALKFLLKPTYSFVPTTVFITVFMGGQLGGFFIIFEIGFLLMSFSFTSQSVKRNWYFHTPYDDNGDS